MSSSIWFTVKTVQGFLGVILLSSCPIRRSKMREMITSIPSYRLVTRKLIRLDTGEVGC